jgi:twitching motility two-component system response regulator PilH
MVEIRAWFLLLFSHSPLNRNVIQTHHHEVREENLIMANILVVDDSVTVSKCIELALSSEGHKLTFAVDGMDAESKLQQDCFDLIITDVVMPRKNGYQLCRDLKSHEKYKNIPIIMLTTKSMEVDKFWGMRQGANEYLVKPCRQDSLIAAVNKFVNKKNSEEELTSTTASQMLRRFTSHFGN